MGKDYAVERIFQARTNEISLEKSKYTDDLFGLLFNKHIRNGLKRNRTEEVRFEYEGKGCEQWKMRINSFACNLGYHGRLEKDLICEKESNSEKSHVLVFSDEHGTEIIITSQTREAGQIIEIQFREGAISGKPDFYDDIIVKTSRFLNSLTGGTEVCDDGDAASCDTKNAPVLSSVQQESAGQKTETPASETKDEEKEIERCEQVRRLSEYVMDVRHRGAERYIPKPDRDFLLKLGNQFFEGRTQILEHGSGNREEDIYTVMCRIAELAEKFRITEESFSDWNVHVYRGCMEYKYASHSGTCYDGGCYSDDSTSYYYNFSVISNSDFTNNMHRGEPLRKDQYNLFDLTNPVSSNPLVFETERPNELYLYKPFGMCDSLKIKRDW